MLSINKRIKLTVNWSVGEEQNIPTILLQLGSGTVNNLSTYANLIHEFATVGSSTMTGDFNFIILISFKSVIKG